MNVLEEERNKGKKEGRKREGGSKARGKERKKPFLIDFRFLIPEIIK